MESIGTTPVKNVGFPDVHQKLGDISSLKTETSTPVDKFEKVKADFRARCLTANKKIRKGHLLQAGGLAMSISGVAIGIASLVIASPLLLVAGAALTLAGFPVVRKGGDMALEGIHEKINWLEGWTENLKQANKEISKAEESVKKS